MAEVPTGKHMEIAKRLHTKFGVGEVEYPTEEFGGVSKIATFKTKAGVKVTVTHNSQETLKTDRGSSHNIGSSNINLTSKHGSVILRHKDITGSQRRFTSHVNENFFHHADLSELLKAARKEVDTNL